MTAGFVYAIGDETGRVKIGWSADPLRRLTKIGSDCSSVVTLMGLVSATQAQETEIQRMLKPWKVNREWFRLEGPVEAFVDMLPRPEPRSIDLHVHPLRKWRLANKKNRDDLAAVLGVSGVTVWRWEVRRQFPDRKYWKAIERFTGISNVDLAIAYRKAAP